MGTDIYGWVEQKQTDGAWRFVRTLDLDRDYNVFDLFQYFANEPACDEHSLKIDFKWGKQALPPDCDPMVVPERFRDFCPEGRHTLEALNELHSVNVFTADKLLAFDWGRRFKWSFMFDKKREAEVAPFLLSAGDNLASALGNQPNILADARKELAQGSSVLRQYLSPNFRISPYNRPQNYETTIDAIAYLTFPQLQEPYDSDFYNGLLPQLRQMAEELPPQHIRLIYWTE